MNRIVVVTCKNAAEIREEFPEVNGRPFITIISGHGVLDVSSGMMGHHLFSTLIVAVREEKATTVFLDLPSDHLDFGLVDHVRLLFERTTAQTVFAYSAKKISEGWGEKGCLDVALFKIEKTGITLVNRWDGVLGQILFGTLLHQIQMVRAQTT
jgi:hypothetical protein